MSELLVESSGVVRRLTMRRPEAMNALSTALIAQLQAAIDAVANDTKVRVLVLTGEGKAFSAGADLKERRRFSADEKWEQASALRRLLRAVLDLRCPVIAGINGHCLGGGLELALAADLRLAARSASVGFPETSLGAFPGAGGTVLLARTVGVARAKHLMMLPRRLSADEARECGVVHEVVDDEAFAVRLADWAQSVAAQPPLAIAAIKRIVDAGANASLDDAFALDASLRRPLDASDDVAEGLAAHSEKRPPRFKGS